MVVMSPAPVSGQMRSRASEKESGAERRLYFVLAVLGFSFWFLLAVPFASHRESYWWLGEVHTQNLAHSLTYISVTYRPFAQITAWSGFMFLDRGGFPTSALRQTLLQGTIYGLFLVAWWMIYSAAAQWRVFGIIALATGGVFFAGYLHLFHIYGIFYVPVMLMLGALLHFSSGAVRPRFEGWLAVIACFLAAWHPFATALFLGFYVGYYLETMRQRSRKQHLQAMAIVALEIAALVLSVVVFPRADVAVSFQTRVAGFMETYRSNEFFPLAIFAAFVLSEVLVLSLDLDRKAKLILGLGVAALSCLLAVAHVPLLLLWMALACLKLLFARRWGLLFLLGGAGLLPIGGIIGAPVFGLFALVVTAFVTAMGMSSTENFLSRIRPAYIATAITIAAGILIIARTGVRVPAVTQAAQPLLAERDRTYQLEDALAWLHRSDYCGDQVVFAEDAGSPIDSIETVMEREHRPPSSIEDVQLFWNDVLRCKSAGNANQVAVVTFGTQTLPGSDPVYAIPSRYAGSAQIWIREDDAKWSKPKKLAGSSE